ncbi:Na+/H+ antiporter subunit E [Methylobacterium sp. WL9]|uniref:Na+/H+ antiporter subunit E n=1 Tax=Methylobacterium sp. WL9 TaxID=2603898 RepID=UPI0011CC7436|nr:Na+/H+ antiporter subunit E [Methylobacterium sp. WL9]TXN23224.1 hypothetical protein FV217_07955 [Methylobacterium sp. WL9]
MVELGRVWVVLAGVYLVLAGSLNVNEVGAAVLCGGLGAIWVWQIGRCGDHHLVIRASALKPLLTALARLPGETWRVGVHLMRAIVRGDVAGEDRAMTSARAAHCPLDGEGPQVAGARAIAVLATSLSPDTYVLRLEPDRGWIRVHAILPTDGRA